VRHITALGIKIIMIGAVLFVVMNMMNNYPIGGTFSLALLVAGLAYLIGDLGVLPFSNNTVATISDIGLSLLTIWVIGPFLVGAYIPFSIALVSSLAIGLGEWFFHKFVFNNVLPRKDPI
jgi:hypothetical protein